MESAWESLRGDWLGSDAAAARGRAAQEAGRLAWEEAQRGPKAAYEVVKRLHAALRDERSRPFGLAALRELERRPPNAQSALRIDTLRIAIGLTSSSLRVATLPSVFQPEAWGHTFLEGLLRQSPEVYDGKTVIELGAGTGWISIALARFTGLKRLLGLDLNPQAIVLSELNAYLNSYGPDCEPLIDVTQGSERRLLFERLEFGESDLLALPRQRGLRADVILGSIPQVLKPDPNLDLSDLSESSDVHTLYDLGNYCELQGVFEDQYGLGLIAAALDGAIGCLAPTGRVFFNLAGRPGRKVIEVMFTKRGYAPREVWRSRVRQAGDTDIAGLTKLERSVGIDFEFFLGRHSVEPINARTAARAREENAELWHDLWVYEAQMANARELQELDQLIDRTGLSWVRRELDLTGASGERMGFAVSLAKSLERRPRLPYTHERGGAAFREGLSAYLAKFFDVRHGPGELFVGPAREELCHALLLCLCDPGDPVLVSRNLVPIHGPALRKAGVVVIEGNDTLGELAQLARTLRPKVALLRAEGAERKDAAAMAALARSAPWVVFDETGELRLSPTLYQNETLERLCAGRPAGDCPVILAELSTEGAPPGLAASVLLGPRELTARLCVAAESSYSRMSFVAEAFHARKLAQALAFQIRLGAPDAPPGPPPAPAKPSPVGPFSARSEAAARLPAFAPPPFDEADPALLRLDYGENEQRVPARLLAGLLAGLLEPQGAPGATGLRAAVAGYLSTSRGIEVVPREIAVGPGVIPLLADAVGALGARLGRAPRIALPAGHYGIFPALIALAGGERIDLPARPGQPHLIDPERLASLHADALLVTQPGNPSGCYQGEPELLAILDWAVRESAVVLADEIFGLVDLREPPRLPLESLGALESRVPGARGRVVTFTGVSKEFAAGGLRLGFAASHDQELIGRIEARALASPDRAARRAAEHLFAAFRREGGASQDEAAAQEIAAYLGEMRRHLREQREKLTGALTRAGFEVPGTEAGLFVLALVPTGKDAQGVARALHAATGLSVNGPDWSGSERAVRAVFSLDARRVDEAVRRLETFHL
ncbi:MAG: aminotransferase class I/II-fold pyridoxal phosphate-dependent enzyme [Deltaproteobacteria bacterium]